MKKLIEKFKTAPSSEDLKKFASISVKFDFTLVLFSTLILLTSTVIPLPALVVTVSVVLLVMGYLDGMLSSYVLGIKPILLWPVALLVQQQNQ